MLSVVNREVSWRETWQFGSLFTYGTTTWKLKSLTRGNLTCECGWESEENHTDEDKTY